jgi:energy-coupling factor transporter ATP-binding protein EcfA2
VRRGGLPLSERLGALRDAVEAGDGHLPAATLQPARDLLAKAGARVALGDATVVALAGATGSGKSTLFNALAGAELSPPGVRRPTTGTAHACVWGADGATGLLDWLGVPRRHVQPQPDPALDGLVLLDLPDHDSTAREHRVEVDRLVQLVDVLVWVLDPQKYADAAVHDRYLRPWAEHAGVLVVALNQVDRLDPLAREACRGDLRRLLDGEGLSATPLLTISAREGEGVAELRALLADRVRARRAASDRLAADAREVAGALSRSCGGQAGGIDGRERARLTAALADAAGVPVVEAAVQRSSRQRAVASTGWPPLRWVRRLAPDPLRRLHLSGVPSEVTRTSLPPASSSQRAAVLDAVRSVRDAAAGDLPDAWRDSLRAAVEEREAALPDRLDRAVAGADLGTQRSPRWWSAVGALQWLLLAVALTGGLWLLALAALSFARLDDVLPVPESQGFPLPTLLLAVGGLGGVLLAALTRPFARAGARRRARRAGRVLRERVERVGEDEVLAPVREVLAAQERWCAALARARA